MNAMEWSGLDEFIQKLDNMGATASNLDGQQVRVTPEDTVETMTAKLRAENLRQGNPPGDDFILEGLARAAIRTRDEKIAESAQGTGFQLEVFSAGGAVQRYDVPARNLEAAQAWSKLKIDEVGADQGALYFSSDGSRQLGAGNVECRYSDDSGWTD